MESGSGVDLFSGFNEVEVGEVSEVLRRCTNCGRFVLIGPPRSGKTFFRENYLEKYLKDRLGAGVTVDEHIPGITTTAKTEGKEAKGGSGIPEKVVRYLEGMIPLIGRLREEVRVEDEELRRILGDRAPRSVVEGARGMIGDSPHRVYYIPWDSDEVRRCMEEPGACAFGADVGKALKLIKEAFGDKKRIKWFKAEYIPPGLVEEVIELIREKGEGGAREVLEDWVDAYFEAIEALSKILGVREDLLEWDELSIEFLSNFVNNLASYVIGGLAAIPLMGAASLALISVLTYMAFKREGEGYLREIIGLRRSLEGLRRRDGEFSELGKLLVYWVAYAMGMSYEEAKEALMGITGLRTNELETMVNEIKGRIEELEKKFELFRQEVPAGIVTADVGEFAKGRIYPNIKVENGELRIRVGDGYHSIVRAGKFNELVNEVRGRLTSNGFVVVVGPKGIGKSTLAAAVIWELFMNGDIGLVARVDVLSKENYSEFVTFVENYGEKFGRLLILYDPVSTESYERVDIDVEAPMQTSIERTVKNLMKVVSSISPKASKPLTLIVIPSDFYNTLSGEMRNALEVYRLDVSQALSDREFLAGLIREYTRTRDKPSGCSLSNDVLSKLAGELVKFDSDHALIARLAGEELARNNCDVGKVEELINNAKGKVRAFIIQYINKLFKVDENPNTAKVLVEVFALRKPFVDKVRPGEPILTPGIIEFISEERGTSLLYSAEGKELRGWLARRQHDLIEESIEELLDCIASESEECKDLKDTLRPWKTIGVIESLREVSEKVNNVDSAVKYFVRNYGKGFTTTLGSFSNKCWKRAALIIGHALTWHPIVPRLEDLPESLRGNVAKSLGDALNRCGVDDYLLVGNVIPPLIRRLIRNYARALAEAFIDEYNEAVAEVSRILKIARGRGGINPAEVFYGLGLASIIARAVESGKPIKPSDADIALRIASFAIQRVALPILILLVLGALEPLHGKAPHRYIVLLAAASGMENLDSDTVRYIFDELNEILDNYGDVVKGHAWSLVNAIDAYTNLLRGYLVYFSYGEIENIVGRVVDLLNELGKFKTSLGVIAWAHALDPALEHEYVRRLMEEKLGIDVVDKASEVLGELGRLRGRVQDLMNDKEFMGYIKSKYIKANEEAVKTAILEATSYLKHALAHYRLDNDELKEAEELFNEVAEEYREIGVYENYLINRGLALRVEAIKGSLVGDELVKKFQRLYEETFKEHFKPTAEYLSFASSRLGEYLVSLALTGNHETISRLLEEHWLVLRINEQVSVLTRLMLNALLGPRVGLSGELEGKLSVNPGELIDTFGSNMRNKFLPALMVALGITKPEDGIKLCEEFNDEDCIDSVLAVKGDSAAVERLREWLINVFQEVLNVSLNSFKELGIDIDTVLSEFRKLVNGFDGKSLVQLIAPVSSMAQLALMLHALINGDEELAKAQKLAKAHALYGAVYATEKLPARLFLEAYRACCDLGKDEFRRAIAKLFYYHV
jgi:KaiC/GvpD/RAD55 family RecA-like ATPase